MLGMPAGVAPLHLAMSVAGPDIVCRLLEAGARPKIRTTTPSTNSANGKIKFVCSFSGPALFYAYLYGSSK